MVDIISQEEKLLPKKYEYKSFCGLHSLVLKTVIVATLLS